MLHEDDATADFSTSSDGSAVDVESGNRQAGPRSRKQERDSTNNKILALIAVSIIATMVLLRALAAAGLFNEEKGQDDE